MCVALFTYRIVLQALGVTDYGINNVVGGVVAMFSFVSTTLMGITQRFVNVEMEKGTTETLQNIFSTSLIIHILIGVIIIIIGETFGLWFVRNKLVIPEERMSAAFWVYQLALFGFFISMFESPFVALVVAHEDIHIYGYVGVFDVIMRLVIAYLLLKLNGDKLILYTSFLFFVSFIVTLFYYIYCRKKYHESKFIFIYDFKIIKDLTNYGGYVFFNSILDLFRMQGVNILLNMFFGPVINAARGLAYSVDNALLSFGANFRQALAPALTKSYARSDNEYTFNLLERGIRITYLLFLIFTIPILLKSEFILELWLKEVPDFTVIFTKLIVISVFLEGINRTFIIIINASGKLKSYYIIDYLYSILIFLFSYIICKLGYQPQYILFIPIPLFLLSIPPRFIIIKNLLNISIKFLLKKAIMPVFIVFIISYIPFYYLNKIISDSIILSFILIICNIIWTCLTIFLIGLKNNEKLVLLDFVKSFFSKYKL